MVSQLKPFVVVAAVVVDIMLLLRSRLIASYGCCCSGCSRCNFICRLVLTFFAFSLADATVAVAAVDDIVVVAKDANGLNFVVKTLAVALGHSIFPPLRPL